jgi:alkyl sulfatase BDS1-like metallo-beta-lactamase superfamily hydrolase
MAADLEQLVAQLAERIDADTAADVDRAYELRFVGDERRFSLTLSEGGAAVQQGPAAAGACPLGLHVDDLADLLDGRTTLSALFSSGRLRVFGDVADAMRLERALPP